MLSSIMSIYLACMADTYKKFSPTGILISVGFGLLIAVGSRIAPPQEVQTL